MTTDPPAVNGILLVDKPEGLTSTAVVAEAKRALRCKVGHLGTLDPFASGLLPLCLGEATKIAQFLNTADKAYEGVIQLGARTATGDRTGDVVETRPLPALSPELCSAVAAAFVGQREQVPPMYSAVKREGVPLYKLARKGIEVERKPRGITIHSLALVPIDESRLGLRTHCSKGTYIRVLAEEISIALGSCGHLQSLRRTRFGHFRVEEATSLPLTAAAATEALIGARRALEDLAEVQVDGVTAAMVRSGRVAALAALPRPSAEHAAVKLVAPDGGLLAVVRPDTTGRWQFARVMTD